MRSLRARLAAATDPERFQLHPSGSGRILDVGCGSKKYPGAVGIDISNRSDADLLVDLDDPPYHALQSDSFEQILCQDVIEHVRDPFALMRELHRVGRPGARIHIRTPHFSSVLAYSDPTHHHYFSAMAVESLAEPGFAHYTNVRFRVVAISLEFWTPFRWLGIAALANRFRRVYETYFAFRLPAMNIRAELEVRK